MSLSSPPGTSCRATVAAASRVLVFDDNGGHPAMQTAELSAEAGSAVEIVSPERYFAPEMGGMNHTLYAAAFHRHGVRITINARLLSVRREGNALSATIGSDHGPERFERLVDQVVVEHGTLPPTESVRRAAPAVAQSGRSRSRGTSGRPTART